MCHFSISLEDDVKSYFFLDKGDKTYFTKGHAWDGVPPTETVWDDMRGLEDEFRKALGDMEREGVRHGKLEFKVVTPNKRERLNPMWGQLVLRVLGVLGERDVHSVGWVDFDVPVGDKIMRGFLHVLPRLKNFLWVSFEEGVLTPPMWTLFVVTMGNMSKKFTDANIFVYLEEEKCDVKDGKGRGDNIIEDAIQDFIEWGILVDSDGFVVKGEEV